MKHVTRHTADVEPELLDAIHTLLTDAFDGRFHDSDWEHALGGMHVIVFDGEDEQTPIGHACVVMRRLMHGGVALRCGYVESVAVAKTHRRQGIGDHLMTEIGRILAGAYDIGGLGATDDGAPLYARHGWLPWRGTLSALTPGGIVSTQDDRDHVRVLPLAATLDFEAELTCDWRPGDVW